MSDKPTGKVPAKARTSKKPEVVLTGASSEALHFLRDEFRKALDKLPSPREKNLETGDLAPLVEVSKRERKSRKARGHAA